jgi:hypothetical protein
MTCLLLTYADMPRQVGLDHCSTGISDLAAPALQAFPLIPRCGNHLTPAIPIHRPRGFCGISHLFS